MEKVKGSMELLSSLQLTNDKAGLMDVGTKDFLKNKEVLAVILGEVIAEYKGYSREEIMEFIEPDSITDQTEVSPGRTNTRVLGDSAEFAALNEKVSYFDLAFRAKNPKLSSGDVRVSLHMDLEPQRTYRPGYPVEKRGMYYLARRLSSQLSLITEQTDYYQLEKCYSIWICWEDIPKDMRYSISAYEMVNTRETSSRHVARENYDLMTLVVIKLGEEMYNGDQEDEGYDLLRFLSAVLYQHERGSRETLSEYIDFSKNEELWKEAEHVSGLGETIFKQGIREGIEQGREEGLEQGREEGKSNGKAEGILDLLEEYGEIPDLLRQRILSEQDLDQLGRWLKLAARSDSIEEFQKKM